ncbi:MAG: PilZ domain-containing protein, partial [Myxococcota bacterium]
MTVRRAPRITAAIGVIVVDGERSTACMTRNVSLTGVFLLTKERWSPDTIVRLEIIRDGERFAVQGQVKFAADDGVALAFHQPTADFTAKFGGFLEDLVKRRPEHDIDVANVLGWRPLNRVSPPPLPSRASLSSLTLDGAAVDTATPPEVGQEILVFVDGHADGQLL